MDLGNYALDGMEDELYKPLRDATHLETLIFSDEWELYFVEENEYVNNECINRYSKQEPKKPNIFIQIPNNLPQNLERLILAGGYININRGQIQEIKNLEHLKGLQHLDLSNNHLTEIKNLEKLRNLQILNLSNNHLTEIKNLEKLRNLQRLDLIGNLISDITSLKCLPNLRCCLIDRKELPYPPIWYVYLESKEGKLNDYIHLRELPQVEKIWQLMKTEDEGNINLARQLAKGQAWAEEEFEMYRILGTTLPF